MINGMTLATFSVGNIIGTEIFQPKDAPAYIPGKTAIMVLLIVQLVVSFVLRWIEQTTPEDIGGRKGTSWVE